MDIFFHSYEIMDFKCHLEISLNKSNNYVVYLVIYVILFVFLSNVDQVIFLLSRGLWTCLFLHLDLNGVPGKGRDTCKRYSNTQVRIRVRMIYVATYPSTGGRDESKGCVFPKRKRVGVATNVYSRKTLAKTKRGM